MKRHKINQGRDIALRCLVPRPAIGATGSGFTLIELLVVIAIIAVLASMLLPRPLT